MPIIFIISLYSVNHMLLSIYCVTRSRYIDCVIFCCDDFPVIKDDLNGLIGC